jgi:hypothetical protein
MGKFEKLTLAWVLFFLAITIYGVRLAEKMGGYPLAREVTHALIQTLNFAEKNFPDEEYIDIGFSIWGNRDTLHIDRFNNEVSSDRNFTYKKDGYTVKCDVVRQGEYYIITCAPQ